MTVSKSIFVVTEEEIEDTEYQLFQSLNYLRHEENKSQFKIDKHKRNVRNCVSWLKNNHPTSSSLEEDMSDIFN